MSETKGRKRVVVALATICIVLAGCLVGTFAYYGLTINDKNNTISSLNSQVVALQNQTLSDNSTINSLNSQIAGLENQFASGNSTIANLQKQLDSLLHLSDFILNDFVVFNNEFGNVPLVIPTYNFSPPISVYRALRIAFESDGWNKSSLINATAARLSYFEIQSERIQRNSYQGSELYDVTKPVTDYSPVQVNDTTYHYLWQIQVETPYSGYYDVGPHYPFDYHFYWVDAATGELVPIFFVLSP